MVEEKEIRDFIIKLLIGFDFQKKNVIHPDTSHYRYDNVEKIVHYLRAVWLSKQFCSNYLIGGTGCKKHEYNQRMGPYMYYGKARLNVVTSTQRISLLGKWITKDLRHIYPVKNSSKELLWVETRHGLPGFGELFRQIISAKSKLVCPIHYLTNKWMPGIMSNWSLVTKPKIVQVKLLTEKNTVLIEKAVSKRQKLKDMKKKVQLIKSFGGLNYLGALPNLVIFSNLNSNFQAANECRKMDISTSAIVDSDDNPTSVDIPIPLNRNSMFAWALFFSRIIRVYAADSGRLVFDTFS